MILAMADVDMLSAGITRLDPQRANLLLENPLSYLNVTRSALDMPGASYEEIGAANAVDRLQTEVAATDQRSW